jgi:pilus assembly protein CpaF
LIENFEVTVSKSLHLLHPPFVNEPIDEDEHHKGLQLVGTPSELLAAALRHRPDRIIMGEIRNECGYDLLQAMNTGHGGTLSTIHAKSALDALNRLSNLALSARPNLNHAFMRSETAEAIDFVLYCERDHTGRRQVRELIAVNGYSHAEQCFETAALYRNLSAAAA